MIAIVAKGHHFALFPIGDTNRIIDIGFPDSPTTINQVRVKPSILGIEQKPFHRLKDSFR